MALLHQAELRPSKLELLSAWLPGRPWFRGGPGVAVHRVAACRFDDPAGEVGIEMFVLRPDGGALHHVPLTYRGAPLDGGDQWLVGTMEHSVLGRRWVYDACGDPVYAAALASAILTGTGQAEEFLDVGGRLERRESAMTVTGSGDHRTTPRVTAIRSVADQDPTFVVTDTVALAVRAIDATAQATGLVLNGTWSGQSTPVVLAYTMS